MKRRKNALHGSWWNEDESNVGNEVVRRVSTIRQNSSNARQMRLVHMAMYGGINRNGDYLGGPSGFYTSAAPGADARRIRFNLAAACVDTAASRIASLKPQPRIQTNDADYSTYLKSRKLTRALEGQFQDKKVHQKMRRCFYDAAVADIGIIYGYLDEDGRPELERVLPMELIVDENECANGDGMPRSIYRYHLIDKEKLCDMFPKEADVIVNAPGPSGDDKTEFFLTYDDKADQVVVIEAWHLGQSGGRHSMTTANGTVLLDEDWEHDWFPFAFYKWKEPMSGFLGVSICEEIAMAQHTINEHIKRVMALQRLGSNSYILVREGSNVRSQQLTNLPMQVIKYTGTAPDWRTVTATPPDLQNEVDRIVQQVMQQLGLSPGGMQGTREPGVTSGVAIQTLNDIQSQRHVINARLFEDFAMDISMLLIRLNDMASELDPEYTLSTSVTRGRNTFSQYRWADIRVDIESDVRISCQPVSALPTTPAGRTDMVEKWLQMGAISMNDAMQQLDFPDTGEAIRRALVDVDYAAMQVERILDGELIEPIPYQNLEVAAQVFRVERLFAEMDRAPEELLYALEDFLAMLKSEQDMLAAESAPPALPMGPMDPAMMLAPEGAGVTPMV